MNVIDLFCGAGGFSLGFKQAGFEITLGVDTWDTALQTFSLNISKGVLKADIRKLRDDFWPDCDVLIGSPPCPDFSIQGKVSKEIRDRKVDLSCINAFYRILEAVKPKFWVWENVPGVLKYSFFQPHAILDAQNFGVPQRRKRAFIGNFPMPKKEPPVYPVAPTILAWELCGGWDGYRTRRFSQWLGRKPTVEEMTLFMGFPPGYKFLGTKKDKSIQIGNAVCPPVARAIAEAILKQV